MSRETLADFFGVIAISLMAIFLFSLPTIVPAVMVA